MTSDNIDGFEIIEKVGEGGMGAVYKARQLSLDRVVALKILRTNVMGSDEDIARFQNEARAAARLNHDGIAQVYDAGEASEHYYYAMAFIDGITVEQWIKNKGMIQEDKALIVVESVATALAYAWQTAGIVHRDIKPANLMVDEDGIIKIVDLGLAGMVREETEPANRDEFIGTPNYSSPEHLSGEETDFRSDMYSLGATLYSMVTGKVPFGRASGDEAMANQINGFLADPRDINSAVSPGTARLMAKMMAKEPEDRFSDWKEAISDIRRVRKGSFPLHQINGNGGSTIMLRKAGRKTAGRIAIRQPQAKGKSTIKVRQTEQKKLSASVETISRQKRKKKSDIWTHLISLAVACIFVGILVMVFAIARSRNQRVQAVKTSTVTVEQLYTTAVEYRDKKPDDYAGAIAKFQKVVNSYPNTLLAQKASDALHKLRRDSKRAADGILKKLRKEAADLAANGKYKEAVAVLSNYSGPLAKETSTARERTAASYRPMVR
ncbi:MAG: protein kinase [Kiritimatiellia bacterium]|jgi:serine/threonine-protein kinase|nr:protein kinase [Kiritimatiellia bacterium]